MEETGNICALQYLRKKIFSCVWSPPQYQPSAMVVNLQAPQTSPTQEKHANTQASATKGCRSTSVAKPKSARADAQILCGTLVGFQPDNPFPEEGIIPLVDRQLSACQGNHQRLFIPSQYPGPFKAFLPPNLSLLAPRQQQVSLSVRKDSRPTLKKPTNLLRQNDFERNFTMKLKKKNAQRMNGI